MITATFTAPQTETRLHSEQTPPNDWNTYLTKWGYDGFHLRREWATVFEQGLRHRTYFLWAERNGVTTGVLPVVFVRSPIFGRILASQPYLNTGGVLADDPETAGKLITAAVELADELDVRHLELRHEQHHDHPLLNAVSTEKVNMRMELPDKSVKLWGRFKSKLRCRIRKPKHIDALTVHFGHAEQLDEFYSVFCCNMRDLGTPPFSKRLFAAMLEQFGDMAEICTVRLDGVPVASGLLLHTPGVTFIPSASALRKHNRLCCNMLMYWEILKRSIELGQHTFDFGRSTPDGGTWRFKKQWGAEEYPAVWQYHMRRGDEADMRPSSGRFDQMIRLWQTLPVWVTKIVGPEIVRGIP